MNIRRIMFRLGKAAGYLAVWFRLGWSVGTSDGHNHWRNGKGDW